MMKMSTLEKRFVNSAGHSQQVSSHAERLLRLTQFKVDQKYLDVGCGNGAAAIHLAQKFQLDVTGIGERMIKKLVGFPNRRALETLFERHKFVPLHRSTSTFHYETVLQKNYMSGL